MLSSPPSAGVTLPGETPVLTARARGHFVAGLRVIYPRIMRAQA